MGSLLLLNSHRVHVLDQHEALKCKSNKTKIKPRYQMVLFKSARLYSVAKGRSLTHKLLIRAMKDTTKSTKQTPWLGLGLDWLGYQNT